MVISRYNYFSKFSRDSKGGGEPGNIEKRRREMRAQPTKGKKVERGERKREVGKKRSYVYEEVVTQFFPVNCSRSSLLIKFEFCRDEELSIKSER